MEESDKDSKSEAPTEKKINDALEDGKVPFSREVPMASALLALFFCFSLFGDAMLREVSGKMSFVVESAVSAEPLSTRDFIRILSDLGFSLAFILAPLLGSLMLVGLIASLAQNEPRLVVKRITPEFSRVSPLSGWNRLFSMPSLIEFLKSFAKLLGASVVVSAAMASTLTDILATMFQSPDSMLVSLMQMILRLLFWVGAVAGIIALVDYVWQRHNWWTELKMSLQDVKDEFKQAEGDQIVKGRIRSLGRDRARNRMISAVPTATLIVANPTHIAVALRYDKEQDAAPVVVATGADLIALRIRQIAEEHDIPVFERIELARALYKVVKVDQMIPMQFYKALAELIRTIYDKRAL